MEDKAYFNSIHRFGRISSVIAIVLLLACPFIIWALYGFPSFSAILEPTIAVLMLMGPSAVSEVFSYAPVLGSSSYIAFITGNIMNLKLPVAISAQSAVNAEPSTPKADAISTMAIALSSLETIIIVALGTLLLTPLQPVLQSEAFQTASNYIIPALFGAMMINTLFRNAGPKKLQNKWLISALPLLLVSLGLIFIDGLANYQGFIIIAMIFVTIGWAYLLYKKGLVKMVDKTPAKVETEETHS